MGIRDEDLEAGLFEAFRSPRDESALQAIQRLHGAGSSLLLRETDADSSPVLLRRDRDPVHDDPRYRILGEIARGGIGVVYKAHDQDLNRDVALKVLRPEHAGRDDVIQRFIEEAQVGGQLQHPGIVPIYGLGLQPDGRPSFVMKLIKGKTLAGLLDDNPRGIDLLAVFEQVAQTIAYAHSRGVIHRDLKPANVMVGAFGEVQVVDWGFAKVLGHDDVAPGPAPLQTVVTTVRTGSEGSQSIAGSVMGTPAYMPPEQAMGQIAELDERSDVFALGAILCEILTGKPPYTGEQKDQLIAAMQCRLEPALERLEGADAAAELIRIARDCLQPLPGDRPRDARVLAERLAAHFASVEDRARQAQLDAVAAEAKAAKERYARRRALVLAAAAMVAILAGGGGYLYWRHDRDAREAEATPRIAGALRRATGHEGQQDWAAAVAAARDAVVIAHSEGIDDAGAAVMLARFEQERQAAEDTATRSAADDVLLAALEEARALGSDHYSPTQIDAAYVAAVTSRWPGMAVDTAELRRSVHADAIAAAFDSWAYLRRESEPLRNEDWQQIDAWARAIDPAANALRDAVAQRDYDALEALAAEQDLDALPPNRIDFITRVLVWGERNQSALGLLRRAHLRHPGDFWINFRLGLAAMNVDDFELAIRHLSAALALRPQSIESRHRLGVALDWQGHLDDALEVWQDAVALRPDWLHGRLHVATSLWRKHLVDEAEEECQKVLQMASGDPKSAAEAHFHLGVINSRVRRDRSAAEQSYRDAIALDPSNPRYPIELGFVLQSQGDLRGAARAFEESARLEPDNPRPWWNLTMVRNARGDFEGALLACREATALDTSLRGWPGVQLCDHLCRYDEAIAEMERTLTDQSLDAGGRALEHCHIGVALRKKREWQQAIESGERSIQIAQDDYQLHYPLALTLEEAGRFADAAHAYRRVVDLNPLAVKANQGLSRMKQFLTWEPQLPELLQDGAASLTPADRASLGWLLLCRQRYAESARCYQEALAEIGPAAIVSPHVHPAIRSAVRAGGEWQSQGLVWIRAFLARQEARWEEQPMTTMVDLLTMRNDPDLAAVRDAEDQSPEWKQYWADHDALIARIQAEATR